MSVPVPAPQSAQQNSGAPDTVDTYCRGFSCPQEPWNDSFAELLAVEFGRGAVRAFLSRFGDELDNYSQGIKPLVGGWLASPTDFDTVWNEAFSQTYRTALARDLHKARVVAATLATHLTVSGFAADWEIAFEQPLRLRWGRALLPPASRIRVSSNGLAATVRISNSDGEQQITLQRSRAGWETDQAEALPSFGAPHTQIVVLPQHALSPTLYGDLVAEATPSIPPEQIEAWQASVELLAQHAPIYLPWVQRVFRQVFALRQVEGIRNGSYEHAFGLVYVSHYLDAVTLAETLIHESAHQYANLIAHLSPLSNGSDPNKYYSPAVRTMRSIDRVLIAYHAFANVLLFYRMCLQAGAISAADYAFHERRMIDLIGPLEEPLRTSPGLTAVGRALADPLLERTHL
ncbi:MAG: hypothetical protein OHK0022_15060 [Roseiflexaceae bacterium]